MFIPEQVAIQATQYIINVLENSKLQSEEALDSLPGIYSVIDVQGQVLKGNKSLAKIVDKNYENLLGVSLSQLFSEENWQVFLSHLMSVKNKMDEKLEFKIDIQLKDGGIRNYLWHVSSLVVNRPNFPILFSILGHDVTDLTKVTKENSRMQYELNTAKIVQNTFFPPPTANFGNSSIASYFETASECGGDWWYYRVIKDKLFLWIGDVTGHGVSAALVVSAVHSVALIIEEEHMSPAKTLAILNRAVGSMTNEPLTMTFTAATIDLKSRECIFASACHEPIIVLPYDRNKLTIHDLHLLQGEASLPLGQPKDVKYEEVKLQLKPRDRLLFYTDGIYDIANPKGLQWSRSVFHRTLARLVTQPQNAGDLVLGLREAMDKYRQGTPLKDDVTFFVFQM